MAEKVPHPASEHGSHAQNAREKKPLEKKDRPQSEKKQSSEKKETTESPEERIANDHLRELLDLIRGPGESSDYKITSADQKKLEDALKGPNVQRVIDKVLMINAMLKMPSLRMQDETFREKLESIANSYFELSAAPEKLSIADEKLIKKEEYDNSFEAKFLGLRRAYLKEKYGPPSRAAEIVTAHSNELTRLIMGEDYKPGQIDKKRFRESLEGPHAQRIIDMVFMLNAMLEIGDLRAGNEYFDKKVRAIAALYFDFSDRASQRASQEK